jgi:hypothetical protein
MRTLLECLVGIVAAAVSLWLIRRYWWATQRKLIAVWLVIAALIYPAFAALHDAHDQLLYEFIGVVLYSTLAWLGWRYSLAWLAAGWALHTVWDNLTHGAFMPAWYPMVCLGFDLVLAAFIVWQWKSNGRKHSRKKS